MDKNEILKKYSLDCNKYMIISSTALVLYGIKDKIKDIDIAVTKDYYDYLSEIELKRLNLLVSQFLDFAELKALEKRQMYLTKK